MTKRHAAALRSLQDIYDELPRIECKQLCQAACGPIACSWTEKERMYLEGPPLGKEVSKETGLPMCPFLVGNKCSVYQIRPLICRLYGLMERMRCPHGCVPERWVSDEEARELLKRVAALDREEGFALARDRPKGI